MRTNFPKSLSEFAVPDLAWAHPVVHDWFVKRFGEVGQHWASSYYRT